MNSIAPNSRAGAVIADWFKQRPYIVKCLSVAIFLLLWQFSIPVLAAVQMTCSRPGPTPISAIGTPTAA